MRKYVIAGNWKLNKTPSEAKILAEQIIKASSTANCEVIIAPSFVCLPITRELTRGSKVKIAAQNAAVVESGAHTGETSVLMLKDLGVEYVILGHSERRTIYKEDDKIINSKLELCLKNGLRAILCIGESLEEREAQQAESVCEKQLREGLKDISLADMHNIIIAYEPVWAIGTGKTSSPEDANKIQEFCRATIKKLYNETIASNITIQYGGSVKPDNVKDLMSMPNIDGALIGGASLSAESFSALINFDK